ncbi:MAG: FAD:protein FMN transferase [Planctomycetes bacterium]|nr:FAD:protein FMN transferase [Planctomycetota bacterium]
MRPLPMAVLCVIVLSVRVCAQEAPPPAEPTVYATEAEVLKRAFPEADDIRRDVWAFSDADRKALAEKLKRPVNDLSVTVFRPMKGEASPGWAVLTEEIGKYHPFTFMVVLDERAEVKDVEVLVYRESRGGEIVKRRFLKQFAGKSLDDPIHINKDVINITGATLSVRALCRGVRKSIVILKDYYLTGVRKVPKSGSKPAPEGDGEKSGGRIPPDSPSESVLAGGPRPMVRGCRMVMGTLLSITIYAAPEGTGAGLLEAGFREAERWDALLSDYRAETPIGELNRDGATREVTLPAEVFAVLARSFDISGRSGGAFDITVGPLVDVWRRASDRGSRPGDGELREARERIGPGHVHLNGLSRSARFDRPGVRIDLGGIGKGVALNEVVRLLREGGVTSGVIDFGGQWAGVGLPPGGGDWPVLVQDPVADGEARAWLAVRGGSVSTTSNAERAIEIAGVRYGHVIDPRSGFPAEGCLSVTVADFDAARADAWSTALFVLGPDEGMRVADRERLAALFVVRGEGGRERCIGSRSLVGRWRFIEESE